MLVDFSKLDKKATYQLMTETIIPRPIAWILSENENNSYNLAPFSYFNAITSSPALISVSVGYRPDGSFKDTRRNLEVRADFVLHIPSFEHAADVTASSQPYPNGVSEVTDLNLDLVADLSSTKLPRLAQCRVAYHCRYQQTIELGDNNQGLLIAEVVSAYLEDSLIRGQGGVDSQAIDPLCRLGGNDYGSLGKLISVDRGPYQP
tara:strand:+ start:910 stop:1524 length:615 start_codon:yes stop_codon:yes gene_type:complete